MSKELDLAKDLKSLNYNDNTVKGFLNNFLPTLIDYLEFPPPTHFQLQFYL